MQPRLLLTLALLIPACGDGGPDMGRTGSTWRLTSVNNHPLPASENAPAAPSADSLPTPLRTAIVSTVAELKAAIGGALPEDYYTNPDELWAAAVLQMSGGRGYFERCLEDPTTSRKISQSTALVVDSISENTFTINYLERSTGVPDTAALEGAQLTLRYRTVVNDRLQNVDVLTFTSVAGRVPRACSLAP
jgi:hypothetical protein